ncbi:MAG: IPT/TIG domain-containing protein [Cyclobacteriaceae bacterium]|jgi:sugar lactone lactonase YvrE|nr:IPT/TIG domain-containing protein [Flammeovirgaceae bacterium]
MKHTTNFTPGKSFAASKKVITWLAAITTVVALTFTSSCKDDEKVVAPNLTITSFSPTSGGPGTAVELIGAGFSPTASLNAVSINGKVCPVTSATATKVTITIPADAGSGFIMITVGGKTAQRGTFTFIPDPIPLVVTSISPTTGPKNTAVTITGTGFSTITSANVVTLNGKVCPVTNATITSLTVTIPTDAGSGNLSVTVAGKTAQSGLFTFIPDPILSITSIAPTTGAKNTTVTIVGAGFSTTAANNAVTINGKVCAVTNATDTQLTVTIPPAAGSGVIKVTTGTLTAESQTFDFIFTTTVSTFAGSGEGSADGSGTSAQFKKPHDLVFDANGNLFVTDGDNHKIRRITTTGDVSTFAGSSYGFTDGSGNTAQFQFIKGIAIDVNRNLYVADENSQRIRKITSGGEVSTLAGNGSEGSGDNTVGISAQFRYPSGVAVDASGNIYVADKDNHRIRKIVPSGEVSTFAGSSEGAADGNGTSAQFKKPYDAVFDASGNMYVTDSDNHKIRKITPAGEVSTFAGSSYGFSDGPGATAQFQFIKGIAIDANGNLYVADENSHRIRKITPAGVVSTLAGTGSEGFADGAGSTAQFNYPTGVAVDANGNVYVADKDNHKIRKITID